MPSDKAIAFNVPSDKAIAFNVPSDKAIAYNLPSDKAIAFNVPSCKVPPDMTDINKCGCYITFQQTVRYIGFSWIAAWICRPKFIACVRVLASSCTT